MYIYRWKSTDNQDIFLCEVNKYYILLCKWKATGNLDIKKMAAFEFGWKQKPNSKYKSVKNEGGHDFLHSSEIFEIQGRKKKTDCKPCTHREPSWICRLCKLIAEQIISFTYWIFTCDKIQTWCKAPLRLWPWDFWLGQVDYSAWDYLYPCETSRFYPATFEVSRGPKWEYSSFERF